MIHLEKFVFNAFNVNTYLLYEDTGECIIIDPANDKREENDMIQAFIEQKKLKPLLNLNTHCHIDHVVGIPFIRDTYNIPLQTHEKETELLENAPLMGELFGFQVSPLPSVDQFIGHGEMIRLGPSAIRALHVPGHSAGSLAFYAQAEGFVITGDALFQGSIGRTDLPGGDYDTLISSIRNNLLSLPPETRVWPGHGDPTTIGEELENNPFFNDYKT